MSSMFVTLPVGAVPSKLARPEAGIAAIRTRLGARPQPQLTVIDTSDLRLLGAGILLMHRVVDGLGEWVLRSSGWSPYLKSEAVEPFGHGDLPEEFSALTTPFRRLAPLGVQGKLSCECRQFTAVGPGGETLATLQDQTLTADLGTSTGTFRAVTVTKEDGTDKQVASLASGLEAVGGRIVADTQPLVAAVRDEFGAGDYTYSDRFPMSMTMRDLAQNAVRKHVHRIIEADLAFRRGIETTPEAIYGQLARVQRTMDGLAWATTGDVDGLRADLTWVRNRSGAAPFSERYLAVLDGLLEFARAPQLGDWESRPAPGALAQETTASLLSLVNRARRLDRHAPLARWEKTRATTQHALDITRLSRRFFGSRARGLRRRLEMILNELDACLPATPPAPKIVGLNPAEAFEAGRLYERAVVGAEAAKAEFIANWPDHQKYLKQLGIKP